MLETIEDVLETLAGLRTSSANLKIEKEEFTIMNSIARQVFRGTALTDRQYNLMKEKLQKYVLQFEQAGYNNVPFAIEEIRQPLRQIDRSKWIKMVDYPDDMPYDADETEKYIAIRFPFKKSDVMLINDIHKPNGYYHNKGSHTHYFALTETYLLEIGNKFFNKDFEIDQILKDKYQSLKDIKSNPENYLPYIRDGRVVNIKESLKNIIEKETNNDLLKIYDRRFRYCLDNINIKVSNNSLEEDIASRSSIEYHSKPSVQSISNILYALYNLDRFPIVIVLEEKEAEIQLHEVINFFRDLVSTKEQSVLFRQEDADSGFNQLIKHRNLNNWVDKNTKIVYISNNKLPKVLLETDWKPNCAFAYNSNNNKNVQMYIKNNCDLVVFREETISPFVRMYR